MLYLLLLQLYSSYTLTSFHISLFVLVYVICVEKNISTAIRLTAVAVKYYDRSTAGLRGAGGGRGGGRGGDHEAIASISATNYR